MRVDVDEAGSYDVAGGINGFGNLDRGEGAGVVDGRDEAVAQEEVAGRVAAEKKLGGDDKFGALGDGLGVGFLDLGAIFVVRADGGV